MKAKQFLMHVALALILAACVLSSCSKDEKAELSVSAGQVSVPNDNTPLSITVTSNVDWSTSQSGNYTFSVTPSSGKAGSTAVSISAPVNTTSAGREATLSISGGGVVKTVALSQPSIVFSIEPKTLEMENTQSTKSFNITTNAQWSIGTSDFPEWLRSVSPASGEGNATIQVTVNDNKNRKEANSYVMKIQYAGTFASVVVNQKPAYNHAPTAPTGLVPADGSTDVSVSPVFSWTGSTDQDGDQISYTVSFSKDQSTWKTISAGTRLNATTTASSGVLDASTKYYFKVTADDGYNAGKTESAVVSFTTGAQDTYQDGGYKTYQTSSKSKPIKLIFTGDGYLPEHFKYGGLFDQDTDEAIEGLFSIEPYKSYREYFTVYKVAAYSDQAGITNKTTGVTRNTAFSCVMEGGGSTGIGCDYEKVFSYALKIPGVTESDLQNTSIAVVINADVYAGTCYTISNGRSVGMIPVHKSSTNPLTHFRNVVCHEYGGHGFGRLADEYRYYDMITEEAKNTLKAWQGYNYFMNLSLNSSQAQSPWARFMGLSGYSHVGMYEGGYLYSKGVWRSETISCMEDNRLYFNTQSRYLIVERIMQVAGEQFTLEKFLAKDVQKTDNTTAGTKSGVPYDFVPLAPPILIEVK